MTVIDDKVEALIDPVDGGDVDAESTDEQSTVIHRLARFGMWQLLAMGTTRASALLVSIIVGRNLGPAAFGRYSYYSYLLNILPALLALGIPGAIAKLVAERLGGGDPERASALYRLGMRAHLVLLPVPVAVCTIVVAHANNGMLLAASVALGSALGVIVLDLEGLLTATRHFHVLGVVAVGGAFVQLAIAVTCSIMHASWPMYVVAQATATCVGVVAYLVFARRSLWGERVVLQPHDRRDFTRFAAVMTFNAVLNEVIFGRPEVLFLVRYRTSASVGLYAAALRATSLAAILPMLFAAALVPEFARLRGSGSDGEINEAFPRLCRLLLLVAAPVALGGAAIAHPITVALYGHRYGPAAPATAILLAGSLVSSLSAVATAVVLTGPRPKLIVELGTIVAVFNIAADLVLIPRYGMTGAACVNVFVQVISIATGVTYATTRLGLHFPIRQALRIAGAAAVAAGIAYVATHVMAGIAGLVVGIVAAAVAYVAIVLAAGIATKDDLRSLRRPRAASR